MKFNVVPVVVWSAESSLETVTREDRWAVRFSLEALQEEVRARRHRLPGGYFNRFCLKLRLRDLQTIAADNSFYQRNFTVEGRADLELLRRGAGLVLAQEEANIAFLEDQGQPYDPERHPNGPLYIPALRAINEALDPGNISVGFVMLGESV